MDSIVKTNPEKLSNRLAIDQPTEVREEENISLERLNCYLSENLPTLGPIISITQFKGGYSNLTYCLKTVTSEYILRRPPIGADIKSAHDMDREFTVLTQVKKSFDKVPQTFINCTDQRVLGFPFYIMQRIIGIILRPKNDNSFSIKEETFGTLSKTFIDTLVRIHSIDLESSSLLSLGKPAGYVQRQVEGWTKRYVNAQTDSLLAMNQVAEWLSQNIPNSQNRSLIHNDYKYDNLVLNPTNITEIIGVLDWEMATVGDPLMDLGVALAYWPQVEDDAIDKSFNLTWLPGNWTRIQLAEYYASLTGTDISQIVFYYVFGLYKNAVIAQQIYSRWKKGFSQDPRFGTLIHVVKSLSAKATDAIKKQKI